MPAALTRPADLLHWMARTGLLGLILASAPSVAQARWNNLGTNQMSAKARYEVIDKWGQTHDIANLFVSAGSQFRSGAACNPTLTIVTLAIRQADHTTRQMSAHEI